LPDGPAADEVPDGDHVRQEARPHRLHDEDAALAGGGEDLPRLGGATGEGLLDEDVLAGLDRLERVRAVLAVRGGDVDGVDGVVRDEVGVPAVRAGDAVLTGEGGRTRGVAGPDGDDLTAAQRGHLPGEGAGDAAGAEDPPPQRWRVERVGSRGQGGEGRGHGRRLAAPVQVTHRVVAVPGCGAVRHQGRGAAGDLPGTVRAL